ncbi:MAG: nucleotidyltransferase [Butyrivibrio sp.]|nr:nucleotidyltransferase [Butyrivibrio sp.]
MKTIGIIAEFNPFHNGHFFLLDECKKKVGADKCIVIMSGDFVQRGAPAVIDKFTRARSALLSGADLVIELPVYYATASAEFFAQGAVTILNRLGVCDHLCFGSESGDLSTLSGISDILCDEPFDYKEALLAELKKGMSFPLARQKALGAAWPADEDLQELLSNPNNILAIEYLKALKKTGSSMKPFTIKRMGSGYHDDGLSNFSSAQAIRNAVFEKDKADENTDSIRSSMPESAFELFSNYTYRYLTGDDFSGLLKYKLISEKSIGYSDYLDVTEDLSKRILANLDKFKSFTQFADILKSKNYTYTRISRALIHILLGIKAKDMDEYKNGGFTGYVRILGQRKDAAPLLKKIHEASDLPVLDRLKDASDLLNDEQFRLFDATLNSSSLYNMVSGKDIPSEYSLPPMII